MIEDFLLSTRAATSSPTPRAASARDDVLRRLTVAAPKAKRNNNSFELNASKRFSNNWQFLASYVWSQLEGNYDGTFQNSTGQLDPNINSAFDYADFLVNAEGRLSNERVHQFKFDGSYEVSSGALDGLNLGLHAPGTSGPAAECVRLLVRVRQLGVLPGSARLARPRTVRLGADLQLSYPIRLGGNKRLNLIMDVFNLFNRQTAIQLDERYNLFEDGECAGIPEGACNGDGGS